jgi:uncharacterized membrane protein
MAELTCIWADGLCDSTAFSANKLHAAFGKELISGTAQLGVNDCTGTGDQGVSFEASRVSDLEYVGTWEAPDGANKGSTNPNGYKGTLTVRK